MSRLDRALIALGSGLVVAGWWTRRPDLFVIGALVLAGYGILKLVDE